MPMCGCRCALAVGLGSASSMMAFGNLTGGDICILTAVTILVIITVIVDEWNEKRKDRNNDS